MHWMFLPLKRYAQFSGRSRRKEFWLFTLFVILVSIVLGMIEVAMGLVEETADPMDMTGSYGPLSAIFSLAVLIPSIAVSVRRLHDINRAGWWILLPGLPYILMFVFMATGNLAMMGIFAIVALVLAIVLLVFYLLPGTNGPNAYGPDPKAPDHGEVFA